MLSTPRWLMRTCTYFGTLTGMGYTVADLAATLAASTEANYVRVVADWLVNGDLSDREPALTGTPIVDVLVAASVAHLARSRGIAPPSWTHTPVRMLSSFWHPGGDRFFAYSLAHTPSEFLARGVIVEQDSLVSV